MSKIMINGEPFELGVCQSQEIYSTDEVRIGTWVDGKPLYRKVFVGTMPTGNTNWISLGAFLPPGNRVVSTYGSMILFSTYNIVLPIPICEHADYLPANISYVIYRISNDDGIMQIRHNNSIYDGSLINIIACYTKAADSVTKNVSSQFEPKYFGKIEVDGE